MNEKKDLIKSKNYHNRQRGNEAEVLARLFLEKNNFTIKECNYQSKIGEIDIIAYEKDILCFIEVKFSADTYYGKPYERVNYYKQRQLIRLGLQYMKHRIGHCQIQARFDIVSVIWHQCQLISNAFSI